MKSEARTCQNCKNQFVIEPDDFAFYEKIKVPPPTWCPECRRLRRFLWRNERVLYRRECDLCQKSIIAIYQKGTTFPVYCRECWLSDRWDPLAYGIKYDFSKPFFEQSRTLRERVPRIAIYNTQSTNSDFTNQSYNNKNAYLSSALRDCEDCAYLTYAVELKNSYDTAYTHHSQYCYGTVNVDKSYQSVFLDESEACVESAFLSNSKNCQQCIGGVNLRAVSHVFFGEQLNAEAFKKKREEFSAQLRSYQGLQELWKKFLAMKEHTFFKFAKLTNCVNSVGDHLHNAKNCFSVFDGFELENVRHSAWVFESKEISDTYGMGGSEFVYESIGVEKVNNTKFSVVTDSSNNVEYGDLCFSSSFLFGCVGLRSKQYCILNVQYASEEYHKLLLTIIDQMKSIPYTDENGRVYRYGEFFPPSFSPFAYNETVAQEHFPLAKEVARAKGYHWRDPEGRHYEITKKPLDLPDRIEDVDDSILKETIGCSHGGKCNEQCTTAFKIIPQELQFYRKMNLPLPRLCPNCRHYQRLKQRNPLKLWHRKCTCAGIKSESGVYQNTALSHPSHKPSDHCPNEFETSYAPDRPEIVYCEQCYNAEVV